MSESLTTTSCGSVVGLATDGVHSFRGIPYAEPPFGPRAYRRPVPARRWEGPRDCTRFGDVVPQAAMIPPFGDIFGPCGRQAADCLNLNVWTPDPAACGLPVAVWIHGGGFYSGSGSDPWYAGAPFAQAGIVTITLNYRLGVFGFLDVDDLFAIGDGCQGNAGLADVACALRWVQENVASFGGDPDNVTVFGQSAGAMLIAALMASPVGAGLFHRAILQSGAANFGLSRESSEVVARSLLDEVGVAPGDLDGLLRVPPTVLFDAQMKLRYRAIAGDLPAVFPPGCDDWLIPMQPVVGTDLLPQRPLQAIAAGSASDVSIIVGSTRDEMRIFSELTQVSSSTAETVRARAYRPAGPEPDGVVDLYRRSSGDRPADLFAALDTDRTVWLPAIRLAEAHARAGGDTRMYRFDWQSRRTDVALGACHAIDLPFVFAQPRAPMAQALGGTVPSGLVDSVHSAWRSFMATGTPTAPRLPSWSRYEPGRRVTMILDSSPAMVEDPDAERRKLWDEPESIPRTLEGGA